MNVLSAKAESELKAAIDVVNGHYWNAHTLSEMADHFERLEKQAAKLGLKLERDTNSPLATLIHEDCGNKTVLLKNYLLEGIEWALPCIHRIEAKDGKPTSYALISGQREPK